MGGENSWCEVEILGVRWRIRRFFGDYSARWPLCADRRPTDRRLTGGRTVIPARFWRESSTTFSCKARQIVMALRKINKLDSRQKPAGMTGVRVFANPLKLRYWSSTAYLFGKQAVKYSAMPYFDSQDTIPKNPDYDLLRLAMIKQLAVEDVRFDFAVQFQTDADKMPIEDPGVECRGI